MNLRPSTALNFQRVPLSAKSFQASLNASRSPLQERSGTVFSRSSLVYFLQSKPITAKTPFPSRTLASPTQRCFSVDASKASDEQEALRAARSSSESMNDLRQDNKPLPTYFNPPAQGKTEPPTSRELSVLRSLRITIKVLLMFFFSLGFLKEALTLSLPIDQQIMVREEVIKISESRIAYLESLGQNSHQLDTVWFAYFAAIPMMCCEFGAAVGIFYMKAYEKVRASPQTNLLFMRQELEEVFKRMAKQQMAQMATDLRIATGKDYSQQLFKDLNAFDDHYRAGTIENFKSSIFEEWKNMKGYEEHKDHAEATVPNKESSSNSSEDV